MKNVFSLGVIRACCCAGFLLLLGCGSSDVSHWKAEEIDHIEVVPDGDRDWLRQFKELKKWPTSVTTSDPVIIQAVLRSIQKEGNATPHKCMHLAEMIVVQKTGRKVTIRLLPGHDERFYECIGPTQWIQVERERFLEAMRLMGVEWMPRKCG